MKPHAQPNPRSSLTPRQAEILEWIRSFIARHGYPPSHREIGEAMSIGSTNGVRDHLRTLVRKGFIETDYVAARGIRIVAAPGTCPTCGGRRE